MKNEREREREHEKSMWRVSGERMWGVHGECICEWRASAYGVCVCEREREREREMCEECVWVKEECTEVCMSVRIQEKKRAQEKSRVHRRMQSVQLQVVSEWARERAENEREERETLSHVPQKVVCVYLLCAFQISLLPVENSDPESRLDHDTKHTKQRGDVFILDSCGCYSCGEESYMCFVFDLRLRSRTTLFQSSTCLASYERVFNVTNPRGSS